MLQILLLTLVMGAALVLLAAAWRAEKRLGIITAVLISGSCAALIAALVMQLATPADTLDPQQVVVELEVIRPLENGTRLAGHIENRSAARINRMLLNVQLADCNGARCNTLTEVAQPLLLQVPAGKRYPFSLVVDINSGQFAEATGELRWQARASAIEIY